MPSPTEDQHRHNTAEILHATGIYVSSFLSRVSPQTPTSSSRICVPLKFAEPDPVSSSSSKSNVKSVSSTESSSSGFPSRVRVAGLNSDGKRGGPAFVGQVFSMCDLTGTGLMAVSTHFDIPFISKRTPEWLKKVFATITKNERNSPVFRFFLDLGDAGLDEMGNRGIPLSVMVQEALDEIGNPGIPLSVISKAAEIQLHYAVDKVLLGNRWMRKATGIQPKFPYLVDSFERRSSSSPVRASESTSCLANSETNALTSQLKLEDKEQTNYERRQNFQFPFGDWLRHPWSKQEHKCLKGSSGSDRRTKSLLGKLVEQSSRASPLLPKITMVGISNSEAGQMSKASLKKTMEDLTRELEQSDQGNVSGKCNEELRVEERDPLFEANVGEYHSGLAKTTSARLVCRGNER